jgi:hypothetical protein
VNRRSLAVALLCASCGGISTIDRGSSAVAGTDGSNAPDGGGGTPTPLPAPPDAQPLPQCPFYSTVSDADRACRTDDDCVLVDMPTCCGSRGVIAVTKSANCEMPPVCDPGCVAALPTMYPSSDGRLADTMSDIQARCQAGLCASVGLSCGGQPCPDGNVCLSGRSCKSIPPGCVPGSDSTCATLLCRSVYGDGWGEWTSPRDVGCMVLD